jgi:hypothetical protein
VVNGKVYAVSAQVLGNQVANAHLSVFGVLNNGATRPPRKPTGLQASSDLPVRVNLHWSGDDPATSGFIIKRRTGAETDFSWVGTTGAKDTAFVDQNITPATTYVYNVCAVNGKGNSEVSTPITVEAHGYLTEPGMVAYWPCEEGTGFTTLDVTGHGHSGALKGEISWSQGIQDSFGISYHGAGNATSRLSINDHPDLKFSATQSFTLVAWARPSAVVTDHWSGVVVKAREAAAGWYGIYMNPNGQWTFRGSQEGGNVTGGAIKPNAWQQIVAIQDGSAGVRSLYVNGIKVADGPAQAADAAGNLWIGQGHAEQESFAGNIDDIRIYNRALTLNEIQALYGLQATTLP